MLVINLLSCFDVMYVVRNLVICKRLPMLLIIIRGLEDCLFVFLPL